MSADTVKHSISPYGDYTWPDTQAPQRSTFDEALSYGKDHGKQYTVQIAQRILQSAEFTSAEKDLLMRESFWTQYVDNDSASKGIQSLAMGLMASVRNGATPSEEQKQACFERMQGIYNGHNGERNGELEERINAFALKAINFCRGTRLDRLYVPLLIGSLGRRYEDASYFHPATDALDELATTSSEMSARIKIAKEWKPLSYQEIGKHPAIKEESGLAKKVAIGGLTTLVLGGLAYLANEGGLFDWFQGDNAAASQSDQDENEGL